MGSLLYRLPDLVHLLVQYVHLKVTWPELIVLTVANLQFECHYFLFMMSSTLNVEMPSDESKEYVLNTKFAVVFE